MKILTTGSAMLKHKLMHELTGSVGGRSIFLFSTSARNGMPIRFAIYDTRKSDGTPKSKQLGQGSELPVRQCVAFQSIDNHRQFTFMTTLPYTSILFRLWTPTLASRRLKDVSPSYAKYYVVRQRYQFR